MAINSIDKNQPMREAEIDVVDAANTIINIENNRCKELFYNSGSGITPGTTINIPGINDYKLFEVWINGFAAPCYCFRDGSLIRGGGFHSGSTSSIFVCACRFTIDSNDNVTLNFARYANSIAGSTTASDHNFWKIVGII